MPFTIFKAEPLEDYACQASVKHDASDSTKLLTVWMPVHADQAAKLPSPFAAELDFHAVVRFEILPCPVPGLCALSASDDRVIIIATAEVVHVLDIDPGHVLIALALVNACETLCVSSEDLGGQVPVIGSQIRLWLKGLRLFPSDL